MEKENLNQSINKDRRKLLGLAGVASAGALLSPLISKAAPTTIIEAGSNVDTASYIIFKDGNTIYAKNGTTGKIDFQGTDAATVINSAISMLSIGGKIFIRAGDYSISSTININKSSIIIEGESFGIVEGSGEIGTTLTFWTNIELMRIAKTDNTLIEGIILKNLKILNTGGARTQEVVYAKDISYSLFENIYINNGGASCEVFKLDAVDQWCAHNKFIGVLIRGIGITGTGLSMQASANKFVNINCFYGCRFWNGFIGVDIQNETGRIGDVDYNYFTNCVFDTTSAYGVKDNGVGNSFIACTFMDITVGNTYGGQSGASQTSIIGCTGLSNASKVQNSGAAIIMNNPGYVTENSGAALSVSDGGMIVHGLSSTPTKARLTGTVAGEIVTVTSLDATNIKVAIKKPDGSSGTSQTIYWEAEA